MDRYILCSAQVSTLHSVKLSGGTSADRPPVPQSHPTPFKDSKSFVKLLDEDGNVAYQAKLREDALDLDPTSKDGNENAPPFHGYSKAGSAEGQLVYAHVSCFLLCMQEVA